MESVNNIGSGEWIRPPKVRVSADFPTGAPVAPARVDPSADREKAGSIQSVWGSPLPWWKRSLDIVCICLAAPVVLPVMVIISAVIKLISPGPALFRQVRIGYRGQRFTCFKFRTMVVNADTGVHKGHLDNLIGSNVPMKKLDTSDSRLIPCGLVLRSLGLDELPQIFNVLRGEMSLVGPRPALPYEYEAYTPRHRQRCEAAPGLTGLWQVSGKNRTTFEEMIDLDVRYARTKSPLLDLKIIFKTIPALMNQARETSREAKSDMQRVGME